MKEILESEHFPACFHRVTVKGLFVREDKLLLVKEPAALSGQWELPGGGLDFGEDIYEGLKREFEEETGLQVTAIDKSPIYAWTWRFDKRRGMDWYYSLVLAYRVELADLNFTKTDECEDIGFFSAGELKHIELAEQTNGLLDLFDPKDFSQPFNNYQT